MATSQEFIIEIIAELERLQNLVEPIVDQNDPFAPLRTLPIGDGRSIRSSKKVDNLISFIAIDLQKNDSSIAERISINELYNTLIRRAFGQALAEIDLDNDIILNADTVLRSVREFITQDHDTTRLQEHHFACTLFYSPNTKPFSIGPVRFEPRAHWLARKIADGTISHATQQRIERAWQGEELEDRSTSLESWDEKNILNYIWKFPFICSVITKGYAPRIGQDKAILAVRIAMTSIALLWSNPRPSKTLLKQFKLSFDFDRTMGWRVTSLSCESGKLLFSQTNRFVPDGLMLEDGAWERLLNERTSHFEVTARVLNSYLDLQKQDSQPNLMYTLFHSLLLFHEACTEQLPLLSTVKFAASLDVLADGDGQNGIKRIIDKRLGLSASHKLFQDGATVEDTVTDIYKYARNKTMHGRNMKLGYDWSETRDRAEQLTRLCLLVCLQWVFDNPTDDNPKHLSR